MNNRDKLSLRLYYSYIVISFISFVACYFNYVTTGKPTFLLPISYALTLIVCRRLKKVFFTLTIMIMSSVGLIRYCFYPILLGKEGNLYFTNESLSLMIYEMVAVFLFLNFYSKRLQVGKIEERSIKSSELGTINVLLISITIALGLAFPSLLSIFVFSKAEGESLSGVISITFSIGMMVIYTRLLSKIGSWKGGGGLALLFSVLIAILYIFLMSVGETNVHRWRFLMIGVPTIYIIVSAFPQYKSTIVSFSLTAIPLAIFFGSFAKFALVNVSLSSFSSYFLTSDSLSVYFGGLNEITNALNILRGNVSAESFMCTLTDLFGNMPVISSFFNTQDLSTSAIYLDGLGVNDQICPLLAQSVIHFGVIGAPILSILMTFIAVEAERFSRKAKTVYSLYGGTMLCVTFSLFMCLNTTILMPNLWMLLIYIVLQLINEKYFIHGKVVYNRTNI